MTLPLFPVEHLAITEARESEFHPTPPDVVCALFDGMREAGHAPLPLHGSIIEPMAGDGAIVRAIETVVPSAERMWTLWELRRDAVQRLRESHFTNVLSIHTGDIINAVEAGMVNRHDLALTNPAWSLALECADACLRVAGHVALHVPLATVETPERAAFFRRHPADLYPLEWRPDYDGRGGVARAVAWLVWGPGRGGRWFPLKRPETR